MKERRIQSLVVSAGNYGRCLRCWMPWNLVRYHTVLYEEGLGCFALCNECWEQCSLEERIAYHSAMFMQWIGEDVTYSNWEAIENAIQLADSDHGVDRQA